MIPREFVLTEDHLKLLRHFNVGWQDCEFGAPAIDPKRPYRNSNVLRDIAEILNIKGYPTIDSDEDPSEILEERLLKLHRETEIALQIVLYTGAFKPGRYVREKGYDYTQWRRIE